MESDRQRDLGRGDEPVPGAVSARGAYHGPAPVHSAKARAFYERMAIARSQPGACSRCGRPNDRPPTARGARGLCSRCRAYLARRRVARKLAAAQLDPDALFALELQRRIHVLESRLERFSKILRAQYKAGYLVGQRAERERWRNMPRDWDSWAQEIDITDKRQHFHRVALAAEG